jgi:copper chaperone CopZ
MTAAAPATIVLDVAGMHCPSCGLLIDETVEELPGVVSSATDVRAGRTLVRLTADATPDPSTIIEAIAEVGYSAVPAAPGG